MKLVFDLEANGLYREVTKLHCLVAKDIETGETYKHTPNELVQGLQLLMKADLLIGHNVIGYDLAVIEKLYPWFKVEETKVQDTLILSRLLWSDLSDADAAPKDWRGKVDGKLIGSHSLRGWGQRLQLHKGDYEGGWEHFSEEMLEYNVRDVDVTERLYRLIQDKAVDPRANELEHRVAFIIARQERHGISFDLAKAQQLTATLSKRRLELEAQLEDTFLPWYRSEGEFVPKKDNKKLGYTAGSPFTKIKLTIFNPGSRHHIADRLTALYGWKPTEFTVTGQPKIDETILGKLPYKEAKILADYFLVQKRLGMLSEGDKSWINLVNNGRIYGSVNTNGAVTGRCTHSHPNLAQVPSVGSPHGAECRELFRATPGFAQVGVDVSGLELRMLAHFMARWDDGAYGKIVCEGDIHTVNQQAAGLATRAQAKTFLYGWMYGAGSEKIGSIIGKGAKEGTALKKLFLQRTPGLNQLITAVQKAAEKGFLIGLDGRHLRVRSPHAALNTLLQSAGALVCKRWLVEIDLELTKRGWHDRAHQILFVHDEAGFECDPGIAEELGKLAIECISRAGDYFKIRVPLTGEAKIGKTWRDCH